ncbi:MAG: right-handed parallel beta-helix repeat-containing protein [Anaerolineae bacterium]|nr:right-handed parallel beta-helix repeat-containing protein [Anaerolineae bacterium]
MNTKIKRITSIWLCSLVILMGTLALLGDWTSAPPAMAHATGTLLYVATEGDDASNVCTDPDTPCRTVQHAVNVAATGDEIHVAAGHYTPTVPLAQMVYITKSLTLRGGYTTTNWTTFTPGVYTTTLDGQRQMQVIKISGDAIAKKYITVTLEGFHITGGYTTRYHEAGGVESDYANMIFHHNTVISNGTTGIRMDGNISFTHNTVADHNEYGIVGGGPEDASLLFTNNLFYHNGQGLLIGGGNYLQIENNLVHHNTLGFWIQGINTAHIHNNTITENTPEGGITLVGVHHLAFTGNTITHNQYFSGGEGGGVNILYLFDTGIITGNFIAHNTTGGYGGGMYIESQALSTTISHNTIATNTAQYGGGFTVIAANNTLVNHNRIYHNSAQYIGGTLLSLEKGIVENNDISDNIASDTVGGLALDASYSTFSQNRITNNSADRTGGTDLYCYEVCTATNNLIARNHANREGSGLSLYAKTARLLHTTLANNTGSSGLYISNWKEGTSNQVWLTNTILVSHTMGISVTGSNSITLDGILWHNTPITVAYPTSSTVIAQHQVWGDPAFANPQMGDFHLTSASAALDRGLDAGVYNDIDGDPRPLGTAPDLGADEYRYQAALVATKHATPNPVMAGDALTYTLTVTNTGDVDLHAILSDTLSPYITSGTTSGGTAILPGKTLTWTPTLTATGGIWQETYVVTVAADYTGILTNTLEIDTAEGITGTLITTVTVIPRESEKAILYLPLVLRANP